MYIFHSTVYVTPGHEEEFENRFQPGTHDILKAPGFLRRMQLRDEENPGRYFYISIWESFAHLEAYRATDAVQQQVGGLPADMFSAPVDRVECSLVGGLLE